MKRHLRVIFCVCGPKCDILALGARPGVARDPASGMKGKIEGGLELKKKNSWANEEDPSGAERGFWNRVGKHKRPEAMEEDGQRFRCRTHMMRDVPNPRVVADIGGTLEWTTRYQSSKSATAGSALVEAVNQHFRPSRHCGKFLTETCWCYFHPVHGTQRHCHQSVYVQTGSSIVAKSEGCSTSNE